VDQLGFQPGVVPLRRCDRGGVQRAAVQRAPPPVQGADLVGDRDMGVQIGVAVAGVPVGEGDGEQPGDVDLPDPAGTQAGVDRGALQPADRVDDGGGVRCLDLGGQSRVGQRPQRRDALHRGERQVIAGHRHPRPRRDERLPQLHRSRAVARLPRRSRGEGGAWVVAASEQREHLRLGHRVPSHWAAV
jgi:hypothetical protein